MKSIGALLKTHFGDRATTIAACWDITRLDGTQYFHTGHDATLTIAGASYQPSNGTVMTQVRQQAGLNVDNFNISFSLSVTGIAEADIEAHLFDGATVNVFFVNWADLTMGQVNLAQGWELGNIEIRDYVAIAEVRSKTQKLQLPIVEEYSPTCRAELGDARCKLDMFQTDGTTALALPCVVACHDKILLMGGEIQHEDVYTWNYSIDYVIAYDPETDTYSRPETNPGQLPFALLYQWAEGVQSIDDQPTYTDYITDIYSISGEEAIMGNTDFPDEYMADSYHAQYVHRVLK